MENYHKSNERQKSGPKFISDLKGAIEANEGNSVHLECQLEPINDSSLAIQWFHNNEPLQIGHRFQSQSDFGFITLDILYAYPEVRIIILKYNLFNYLIIKDSGQYTCVASSKYGQDMTETTVKIKNKIKGAPEQSSEMYEQMLDDDFVNEIEDFFNKYD